MIKHFSKRLALRQGGFFVFTIFYFSLNFQAQESVSLNGENFYVYPHGRISTPNWAFISATNKKEKKNLELLFRKMLPDMAADSSNFEESFNYFKRDYLVNFSSKINPKTLIYIRSNGNKFYEHPYNLFQTITPSIDKIADGKYVQFYTDFLEIDKKGNLSKKNNQIAGFFSLKDNLIDGFSYCINALGDTLEKGYFENGKRVGKWEFYSIMDFSVDPTFVSSKPVFDKVICHYKDGLIDGEYLEYKNNKLIFKGEYDHGEASGEWFVYEDGYYFKGKEYVDSYYLKEHFAYAKIDELKPLVSHKTIIRSSPFQKFLSLDSTFFKNGVNDVNINFSKLFKFYSPKEEDFELPEEKILSYEGEDYEAELASTIYLDTEERAWIKGKYISKAKLIDSVGVILLYDGIYEEFYANGQKKFKYEIKNGEIVKEDTLFWDNGKAAHIIDFDDKTKEFTSTIYNNEGRTIKVEIFDSLGEFKKVKYDNTALLDVEIDGLKTNYYKDIDLYEFNHYDTLKTRLNEKLVFYKSWYGNKKPCLEMNFDPKEKIAQIKINSINQTPKMESNYTFGEDYKFFSAKSDLKFKNLTTQTISNGSYKGNSPKDSIINAKVFDLFTNYEITEDYQVLLEEKPFTGTFEMNFEEKKPSFKIKTNSIKFNLSGKKSQKKIAKEIQKYFLTGKSKQQELLSFIDVGQVYENNFKELFPVLYSMNTSETYYQDQYDDFGKNAKSTYPFTAKVLGNFSNGKPHGLWTAYDQFGKIRTEINFENGEKEGSSKQYDYAYPFVQMGMEYYEEPIIEDLPKTKTYYLQKESSFHKGILNGSEKMYDWQGNVTFSASYKDGFIDGLSVEKNKLITNESNYEEGLLDGIARTKLSLPGKDTILLYELNFQNHMLQGESKSFHANGNLAKHGFFLNGEPIQDYEAFDSLGTKYHYVKFQYAFPIEEKIWEENELSVRYLYDWKDSIYFRPNDLVNIPSTYDLLYQFGLMSQEEFEQPYYGRPSIIEKTGIKYQITKYYPDQTVARDGSIDNGKKVGCWFYNNYSGRKLYEIDYFDTILKINDSIKFKSKGIRSDFDSVGNLLHKSYVIEKIENYDCSHTDHYEVRQFMTIWEANSSIKRMNNYVKNYYDDGTLQSEGNMLNGLPSGVWKYYTPNGQLNQVGEYVQGKRHGRWLKGDLSKTNYLGDICMNPNLPDLEKRIAYQENLLDIQIRYFKLGKIQKTEFYDINLNVK
ncbi:MAG: hypothetical protein V4622_06710 [Bacteroidota bacterium]